MRSLIAIALAAVALSPAHAEERTDRLKHQVWPGTEPVQGSRYAYEGLRGFAICIVRDQPDMVRALLRQSPYTEQVKAGQSLVNENIDCMQRSAMSFAYSYLRGALVEALYARDFSKLGKGEASVRLAAPFEDTRLASCIASSNPVEADTLVRTPPVSGYQDRSYRRLTPDILKCANRTSMPGPPPQMLPYQIAEALYRAPPGDDIASDETAE